MSVRTAVEIAARLMAVGMNSTMPVVIVSAVSRPNERRWSGSLSDMPAAMAEIGIDEPVLIGIGDVFRKALRTADVNRLDGRMAVRA